MKYVVSSAAEAEMTALFLTAKEMVPLCHTLTKMGWKQPPSPLQSDNSTAVGMTNCTLIPRKSKSWDLRLTGYVAERLRDSSIFNGIKALPTIGTTAQRTTQSFTMKPNGQWVFLVVCFTLTFAFSVETIN